MLIAGQNDFDIFGVKVNLVNVGHEMSQVAHDAARPVVDKVLKEILVIEYKVGWAFLKFYVDVPSLQFVPNERVVNVHIEL